MNSSAVDARVVIAVEKILDAGCVIYSEKVGDTFRVEITTPSFTIHENTSVILKEPAETYHGQGSTFPEAFKDANRQVPTGPADIKMVA